MISSALPDNFDTTLGNELKRALVDIFTKKEQLISDLETVQTVAGWLGKAKQDKKKIPSLITNEAIKWLLSSIVPHLSRFLINSIKIETEVHRDSTTIKKVEVSFSLKPYVEYVMKVNEMESRKARMTFNVTLTGKLENIQLPAFVGRRHITIEKLIGVLTVSIIKLAVYVPPTPIIARLAEPVILSNNQFFKAENLSFLS